MQLNHLREFARRYRRPLGWVGLSLVTGIIVLMPSFGRREIINSYESCAQAGYPIAQTDPLVCHGPSKAYTGPTTGAQVTTDILFTQPFQILVDGDSGGTYGRTQVAINNQADWQKLWHEIHASLPSQPPLLPVDFAKEEVLVISEGQQPTTGYSLKVTAVMAGQTSSTVSINEQTPGNCPVTQQASNRYLIISTAKLTHPVSFKINTTARQCN